MLCPCQRGASLVKADNEQTQYEVNDSSVEPIKVGGILVSEYLAHCRQERLLYRL